MTKPPENLVTAWIGTYTGMIFFTYLTDFNYFPLKKIFESCRTWSEQVKNGPFGRGCRLFQLFFIDFQIFYFLTRIIPAYI